MCLPPTRICDFFFSHFFKCTTRFARFFNLCLSKSNEIRPEQQWQDQATSEELRIVWSLETLKIHGPKWSPLAKAEKGKRIATGGSFTITTYKFSICLHVTCDFQMWWMHSNTWPTSGKRQRLGATSGKRWATRYTRTAESKGVACDMGGRVGV